MIKKHLRSRYRFTTIVWLISHLDLPQLSEGWERTNIGRLLEDESMQPYLESQRDRAVGYLEISVVKWV